MSIVYNYEHTWAVRLPFGKGLFFVYDGKDSYWMVRSWDWTKYDFLDVAGFENSEKYFGEPRSKYTNWRG